MSKYGKSLWVIIAVVAMTFIFSSASLAEEDVLTVAQAGDIGNIDNLQAVGAAKDALINVYDWQWIQYGVQEIDGVLVTDTSVLLPAVVEEWSTEILEDGRARHRLKVREDAYHHSGNPITAYDLKWLMDRRFAYGWDSLHRAISLWFGDDEDAHYVEDTYTYVYTTRQDMPLNFNIWTQRTYFDHQYVIDNAPEDQAEDWYRDWLARNPASSGPFKLESWDIGVEMVLVKNENYWGEPAGVDRLVWRTIPDLSARVMMLREGHIDVALDLPTDELIALEGTPGVEVLWAPSNNKHIISYGVDIEPFDDVRVRQALAYAFPYDDVLEYVYLGQASNLTSIIPPLVEHSIPERVYDTDLNKAKALLEEAGIEPGYAFPFYFSEAHGNAEDIAIIFQSYLASIGYDLEINRLTAGEYESRAQRRDLPLFFQTSLAWMADAGYEIDMAYKTWRHTNLGGWGCEEFDALSEAIDVETDPETRQQLIQEAQDWIMADVPTIYVAAPDFGLAMRDHVEGYVVQNTGLHHFWEVELAH